jgi:hypothetical protein
MADKKYEDKPGDGVLFKNERKTEGDKLPDSTGYVLAHRDIKAGERLRLAGWKKKTNSGGSLLSLKLSDEREQSGGQSRRDDREDVF